MFSYEICKIIKNTLFYKTPPVDASVFIYNKKAVETYKIFSKKY